MFRRSGDVLEVEDLGSLNGTWVNGRASRPARGSPPTTRSSSAPRTLRVLAPPPPTEPAPAHDSGASRRDLLGSPSEDELRPITALFADIMARRRTHVRRLARRPLRATAFYIARAGDLQRALWYLVQAAQRATAAHAYTQAEDLWTRAASLAEKVEDEDAERRIARELWQLNAREG